MDSGNNESNKETTRTEIIEQPQSTISLEKLSTQDNSRDTPPKFQKDVNGATEFLTYLEREYRKLRAKQFNERYAPLLTKYSQQKRKGMANPIYSKGLTRDFKQWIMEIWEKNEDPLGEFSELKVTTVKS